MVFLWCCLPSPLAWPEVFLWHIGPAALAPVTRPLPQPQARVSLMSASTAHSSVNFSLGNLKKVAFGTVPRCLVGYPDYQSLDSYVSIPDYLSSGSSWHKEFLSLNIIWMPSWIHQIMCLLGQPDQVGNIQFFIFFHTNKTVFDIIPVFGEPWWILQCLKWFMLWFLAPAVAFTDHAACQPGQINCTIKI